MKLTNYKRRKKIQARIGRKLRGTPSQPRLSVFRSNKSIYCQLIDDVTATTIASASSRELSKETETKTQQAKRVGSLLAQRVGADSFNSIVFDRSGYLYHGRVKALAEGAREGGLKF